MHGRNLPPGETIGKRLAALRKRRRISQRALARLVKVSHPTIVQLERHGTGRLATLDRVLAVLGAGPVLVGEGESPKFFSHAGNSSGTVHWNTPQELLSTLYAVFGPFDLDPCSPSTDKRRAPVRARVHFTSDDDGLNLPWQGVVFVNPPYGREIARWVEKAKSEVQNGNAKIVVALLPSRTDTAWWHDHIADKATVIFLRGRLSFGAGGQSAPFPSALVLWGVASGHLDALAAALPDAWNIAGLKPQSVG
ncbi:MAG: DNA N-6-adenine-methyltransferase [Bryobacteraceae bacterium]